MKKCVLFSLMLISLLAVSCAKEYNCECTSTTSTSGSGTTTAVTTNTIKERKRSEAQAQCEGLKSSAVSPQYTLTSSCTLK